MPESTMIDQEQIKKWIGEEDYESMAKATVSGKVAIMPTPKVMELLKFKEDFLKIKGSLETCIDQLNKSNEALAKVRTENRVMDETIKVFLDFLVETVNNEEFIRFDGELYDSYEVLNSFTDPTKILENIQKAPKVFPLIFSAKNMGSKIDTGILLEHDWMEIAAYVMNTNDSEKVMKLFQVVQKWFAKFSENE